MILCIHTSTHHEAGALLEGPLVRQAAAVELGDDDVRGVGPEAREPVHLLLWPVMVEMVGRVGG